MALQSVVSTMIDPRRSPGEAAQQAFRTGVAAAAAGALGALALLVWSGTVTPAAAAFGLVVLFHPYLLVAASVLSAWLGLGKDVSNLRRVTRTERAGERWQN
jgi:hypothetical protein